MTRELLVSSKSWNPRNPWLPLKTGGCPGLLGIYSGGGAKSEIETGKDLNF
jgi:hypothetical protein